MKKLNNDLMRKQTKRSKYSSSGDATLVESIEMGSGRAVGRRHGVHISTFQSFYKYIYASIWRSIPSRPVPPHPLSHLRAVPSNHRIGDTNQTKTITIINKIITFTIVNQSVRTRKRPIPLWISFRFRC